MKVYGTTSIRHQVEFCLISSPTVEALMHAVKFRMVNI